MTRSPLWREFESGSGALPRLLRFLVITLGLALLALSAVVPLPWQQQAVFSGLLILLAIFLGRRSSSYLTTLMLVLLSCFGTLRYIVWRGVTVYQFFTDPGANQSWVDGFFVVVLLLAEAYALMALALGYLQTLWPLRRAPVPLPEDPGQWPEVDLLIPTLNEPLHVVKYTALAALNIDWPADKINVYLLDDGRREEFRAFAEEAGIGYMTRATNENAKAGNVNRALERLSAPFVAIFDADQIPTRSFLQLTMGWFQRDARLALLQTPHHFYSPDPFERNLDQFHNIPSEDQLFYGVVQDGNDLWNATSFCGSCAVLRRSALDEVGGFAVETVTEDAHTSLRLQARGWGTAYINIPQAAGLATERLSGHIRQRVRWARGMVQILRLDNPLFAPGLSATQRLCYFNSMAHFLFALPRLIFLTAPLMFLIFGHTNLPGYWAAIVAYALPHLALLHLTHSRIQGEHRHSFWNEIYETVLAPYVLFPTLFAFLQPRRGDFGVTSKGQTVERGFFDGRIARPFLVLLLLNAIGLLFAIPRAFLFHASTAPGLWGQILSLPHALYDGAQRGVIAINVVWTLFNVVLLGVATAVAWESQQRRRSVRVAVEIPAGVVTPGGVAVQGVTTDLSSGGVRLRPEQPLEIRTGDPVSIILPVLDGDAVFPATVIGVEDGLLRARFDDLTLQQEEALTMVLYSRADSWLGEDQQRETDRPLLSIFRILRLSLRGLRQAVTPRRQRPETGRLITSIVPTLLLAAAFSFPWLAANANRIVHAASQQDAPKPTASPKPAQIAAARAHPTEIPSKLMEGVSRPHPQTTGATSTAAKPAPKSTTSPTAKPDAKLTAQPATKLDAKLAAKAGHSPGNPTVPAVSTAAGPLDVTLPLSQLGHAKPLDFRASDSAQTIQIPLSATQLVRSAVLTLHYQLAPGVSPQAQLRASLNGALFATLPLGQQPAFPATPAPAAKGAHPADHAASPKNASAFSMQAVAPTPAGFETLTLTLPVDRLDHHNELTLEFLRPASASCGPASSAWARIDPTSALHLQGDTIALTSDLALLPLPFYESGVTTQLNVPFVFPAQPSSTALEAAGVVASWFGVLADNTPVHLPVHIGAIPSGNVVLFVERPAQLPPALAVPGSGPRLAVRNNPSDPASKVLIIAGDNPDQLLAAARALALAPGTLSGATANASLAANPAFRNADDAPRWLNTAVAMPISATGSPSGLETDGTNPLTLRFTLPPDLYFGTRNDLRLRLHYRYNGLPLDDDSTLQLALNGHYVSSIPLPHSSSDPGDLEATLIFPVADLRPSANTLALSFLFHTPAGQSSLNLKGAVLESSTFDARGIPHWAALPNLALFDDGGYPFTRFADLSQTSVILPDAPTPEEIQLYLALLARFGAATGAPGVYVQVTNADGMDGSHDLLVIGSVSDSRALDRLHDALPIVPSATGLQVQTVQTSFSPWNSLSSSAWSSSPLGSWLSPNTSPQPSGTLNQSSLPDAILQAAESPLAPNRSLVVLTLRDSAAAPAVLQRLSAPSPSTPFAGSVSILNGGRWTNYRLGNGLYHVGVLPLWDQAMLFAAEYPWMLVVLVAFIAFLLAVLLRAALRRRARRRLLGEI